MPNQSSNEDLLTNEFDDCGVTIYSYFKIKSAAEKFINANSDCDKEKFFYIFNNNSALVGPWKDATRTDCSPQWADKYDRKGNVIFNGLTLKVTRFVHTHPDNSDPSPADHAVHNFFMKNGGSNISTEILFGGIYYRYN